jgi:CheY-like chemotaxis protein
MSIADRGAKAVELVANNKYDLILMDIQMPEMNGVQTAAKIRQDLKCNTPIMAMTASVMQGERENCVKVGMNDYISKPFNPAELNQKMWDLLPKKESIIEKKITNINYLRNAVGGDLNAIKEILEIYLSKTPPLLDALENDLAVNKTDNIEAIVHNLKNSVGIIGADALFHLLDTIEANLHKKQITPDTISMIKKMIVMARQSMREIIDEYKLLSA